jgi:hypothetical protein
VAPEADIEVGFTVGTPVNSALPFPFVNGRLLLPGTTQSVGHDVAVSVAPQTRSPHTSPVLMAGGPDSKLQENPKITDDEIKNISLMLKVKFFILSSYRQMFSFKILE